MDKSLSMMMMMMMMMAEVLAITFGTRVASRNGRTWHLAFNGIFEIIAHIAPRSNLRTKSPHSTLVASAAFIFFFLWGVPDPLPRARDPIYITSIDPWASRVFWGRVSHCDGGSARGINRPAAEAWVWLLVIDSK